MRQSSQLSPEPPRSICKSYFFALPERLARRVSQFLEHEAPSLPARMEIELRLAELEQEAEALTSDAEAIETWSTSH
jgi:hypothetical protein